MLLGDRFWVVNILFVCLSNLNFLHNSLWITLLTQSCRILCSFFTNLLHLLIMWLIISSLSSHNLHLLFCCMLSIFALMWFVFMVLFCAAIRRDSVFLIRFPFLSHVHVFSCEMSLVSCRKLPCFFRLLFSGYCRSAGFRVVSSLSGGYNWSSSVLFYAVFESLYRCVTAVTRRRRRSRRRRRV